MQENIISLRDCYSPNLIKSAAFPPPIITSHCPRAVKPLASAHRHLLFPGPSIVLVDTSDSVGCSYHPRPSALPTSASHLKIGHHLEITWWSDLLSGHLLQVTKLARPVTPEQPFYGLLGIFGPLAPSAPLLPCHYRLLLPSLLRVQIRSF